MGTSSEAFRFVDLFAGLGGFHVALDELEGRGVFAAEWEPTLRALYKVNFGIDAWGDLNDLSSDEIIAKTKELQADLLVIGELKEVTSVSQLFYDEGERIFRKSHCPVVMVRDAAYVEAAFKEV